MIYKKIGAVCSDSIDAGTKLSVLGAFRLVENGITELMSKLKIDGITVKKLYNAFWVFTKNRIKFLKTLNWGEKFTVESFITSYSLVKLCIETAIKNENGEIAVYSKCELCALDAETGKIRKTSTVGITETFEAHSSPVEVVFGRFDGENSALADTVKVRSTNVDFSLHTNNVEYVRFLLNAYSVEELLKKPVKEMEIDYINQSYENDELQIYRRTSENCDVLTIKKADTTVIKSEIIR